MADIIKQIELTEHNQSGPYYNVYWTADCNTYTPVVENPVYLPYLGSTANVTVDDTYVSIKMVSIGQCTNEIISGSCTTTTTTTTTGTTTTTTTSTTTTSTTTTSTTTTTTTTTTSPCSEWDLTCPSNASGNCQFLVDCCSGTQVTYQLAPDQDGIACVEAGGTVVVQSASGTASPLDTPCGTDCGDVTTTTTTTSTTTTSTTSTTTTTTTTTTCSDCTEYELECRSGAIGGYCTFTIQTCEGVNDTVYLNPDTNEYICACSGSVSVSGGGSGAYYEIGSCGLYQIDLEYGSVDCATVCSNYGSNPSGTFFIDNSNFLLANYIYTDTSFTPAPANYYTDGTNCRPATSTGALGSSSSC